MGVRGLQTFLKNNSCLSQRVELSNTSLVIDANNLLCYLFCNLCQQRDSEQWRCDIYGGDLVAYAQIVEEFFKNLDKCNINPILVFDGSVIGKQSTKDQLVLKEKAIHKRCLEMFEASKLITEQYPGDKIILSQLINHVFRNLVSDLGIQRIQSPFEADTHIARIANDMNCLVLTNDSDFIIYSLAQGFIMLDFFYYKHVQIRQDGSYFISCFRYSHASLMRYHTGLRSECMPLLSILLGNDYVEAGTFDRVLDFICNSQYRSSLIAETWSHRRIVSLLEWLRDKTLEQAIDYILRQLHSGNRERLRQVIKILLRNYRIEETDNFEAELKEIYPSAGSSNEDTQFAPPSYLRRLFETKDLSPVALDIIFHNTHYSYSTVNDFNLPSSNYVRYRPFMLSIALLRAKSSTGLTKYRRQVESEKDAFYIYDRMREDYCKIILKPMENLDGFGSLENLNCYTTIALEPALKRTILLTTFRFNNEELNLMTDTLKLVFTGDFINESCICLLLIKYIGLETSSRPKAQFVEAIMLTLFYYAALNGRLNKASIQDIHYGQLLLRLRPHSIKNNGKHYEDSTSLYKRICHFIGELQSAYAAFCMVNSILNHVFQVPRYEKFLNGTLIFRLTKLMRLGELRLEALCHEMPVMVDVCNSMKVIVNCDD